MEQFIEIPFARLIAHPSLVRLLPEQMKMLCDNQDDKMGISENLFAHRLLALLETEYRKQRLKIGDLASAMGISERHLLRKIRTIFGATPTLLLTRYRLLKGLEQLLAGETICLSGPQVGFSSYSYYSRCFKREFGINITQFLREVGALQKLDLTRLTGGRLTAIETDALGGHQLSAEVRTDESQPFGSVGSTNIEPTY